MFNLWGWLLLHLGVYTMIFMPATTEICRKDGEDFSDLHVHFGHPVMEIKMSVHHTDIPSSV
jgi:hypothetical protein